MSCYGLYCTRSVRTDTKTKKRTEKEEKREKGKERKRKRMGEEEVKVVEMLAMAIRGL